MPGKDNLRKEGFISHLRAQYSPPLQWQECEAAGDIASATRNVESAECRYSAGFLWGSSQWDGTSCISERSTYIIIILFSGSKLSWMFCSYLEESSFVIEMVR